MSKYVFKKARYKLLVPLFDLAGSIIFFPGKLFKKNPPADPKSILVVRLDHIGDFVCTSPVFENLKKRFPSACITALINSASKDLAYANPNIDKVITYSPAYLTRADKSSPLKGLLRVIKDVRALKFDLGFDPRGDLMSIIIMWLGGVKFRVGYGITGGDFLLNKEIEYDRDAHIVDRNLALLKGIGVGVEYRSPKVYFDEKDIETVEELVKGIKRDDQGIEKGEVVLHPFAGASAKEWSRLNFQELISRLNSLGKVVILAGSQNDDGVFTNVVDTRGRLSLPQLAYLIKTAGYFIGLDSGPANIAATLNVPSVIICSGTNRPQLWIPNNSNVKFVYRDTECKPCENKVCPKKTHDCMSSITVDEVMNAFNEVSG